MDDDRTELHDLAGRNRPLETDLKKQYRDWAGKAGVIAWDRLLTRLLAAWNLQDTDG